MIPRPQMIPKVDHNINDPPPQISPLLTTSDPSKSTGIEWILDMDGEWY